MLKFLWKLTYCTLITWLAWKIFGLLGYPVIGLVFATPAWAASFARDGIEFFSHIKYWGKHAAHSKWSGRYYSFDGRQIRFFLVDGIVWIPLKDLQSIIEPAIGDRELRLLVPAVGKIPVHDIEGVSEDGLMRLINTRTESRHASYKMIRFKRWLLHSALHNVKRLPVSATARL